MFDWREYLTVSQAFLNLGKSRSSLDEACYRSAISRAYYYVFNRAKKFAEGKGWERVRGYPGGSHQEVIDYLNGSSKTVAGTCLSRFRYKRVDSDYKEKKTITEKDAEAAMIWVKDMEKELV